MATDRTKIIIFADGPEEGKKIRYTGPGGPPPQTHGYIEDGSMALYERRDITPKGNKIHYEYRFQGWKGKVD